ncbi:succinate dehydrogenase / fumarate reductase membrane anchor subunit [Rhodoligotrophos appendicifer]|uniref:succinate dehydrogenase, hydrophobic membrane anchor protein n=1 Tax=Rhodoligotrophos appendicifer TaxID=987056 RepID=UPI001180AA71|nr:succinate dehydrogenase, hydrophobic membrane anchor protein [Rhodoligotrophos appendicifer]
MATIKTPLARARGLGAAHGGTGHWIRQRVTAVSNIPLVLFLILTIAMNIGATHAEMIAWISQPLVALLLIACVLSITYHMRLGMQVVIEDYVHGEGWKISLLLANTFYTLAIALICSYAIIGMAFTAPLQPAATVAPSTLTN